MVHVELNVLKVLSTLYMQLAINVTVLNYI